MAASKVAQDDVTTLDMTDVVNEVRLVGRLSAEPEEKELPSGDVLVSFRVVVPRVPDAKSKVTVDALECVAWTARAKRSVRSWRLGDVVEVTGSLRRRFFRTAAGPASRVEVEVTRGRVVRRART
ncbi:single-stranded DNA-binding protein [Nocardioides sp.]|uniref:single-stranded DNA-binding protein n=1 Tax=Nocardioides sp. TaxID=35761 RepID=UPI0027235717|nr:single-stranded DNA-binding protein [Nocardioides sp.]MDO9455023.1 single-stranded DNA-binding protein [Nocardioides sp.]